MPLDEEETKLFLKAIKGHRFELLFTVTLFTGLREGEALGLTWDRIDFKRGTILINRQLQKEKKAGGEFRLVSLKNDRPRRITPAPWVMQLLKDRKVQQYEHMEKAGEDWSNPLNLVFTNELGGNLIPQTVVRHFKEIVTSIGRPDARFHDLRHSYAVASIRSGDDIKTVQGNLGHATAAFTLDVYGHVTDQMREASSMRMQAYIQEIMGQAHQ
jgi:integrase